MFEPESTSSDPVVRPTFSAESLKRAAIRHLERYAASESDLRRVLERRIDRFLRRRAREEERQDREDGPVIHAPSASLHDDDLREAIAQANRKAVDDVVALCLRSGLVDDRRYAELKVVSGRRRGWSRRRISGLLAGHGVDRELAAAALEGEGDGREEGEDPEFAAACRFVQRRRLGQFRTRVVEDATTKDIAALMRAGFALAVARRALAASGDDEG
ncbi:RecX family transcriptional regulator [Methylobrevis pamukkalensis]|uniref:Regulatory protein RecX n=1 Tax=Methylobrevis pamukkalensis TaxID=1439726 RepID=A0A1E3H290_9HYPH|nr:RecX family transcriptional regulator [Methylobrevis pamukkalensis]ODN70443.1 recombination regulator RecX [Methylobrevis pamukkalensis]